MQPIVKVITSIPSDNIGPGFDKVNNALDYLITGATFNNGILSLEKLDGSNISVAVSGGGNSSGITYNDFYNYTASTETKIDGKLDVNTFNLYSSNTLSNFNNKVDNQIFYDYTSNTLTNINSKLFKTDFDNYSSNTLTNFANKVNTSDFIIYSSSTLNDINSRLLKNDFDNYSASTNSVINANTLNIGNKLNTIDFNLYSSSTLNQINDKLDTNNYVNYTSNTLTNINSRLVKNDFDSYSAYTNSNINLKLNTSDFNPYSSNTLNLINNKVDASVFLNYTSNTLSVINNKIDNNIFVVYSSNTFNQISGKLNILDFNLYSSSTTNQLNTKLNVSEFNPYSSSTLSNINSRLVKSDFDVYSAYTNSFITANTLNINNKLNISDFNPYSGATLTNINTRLIKSDFDSYSAFTNTRIINDISGATNNGGGFGFYNNTTNKNLNFNTLSGGTNITLSQVGNVIKIDTLSVNSSGLTSLNGLTLSSQSFSTGVTGTDFNVSSVGSIHSFNLPIASSGSTGKLSSTDWNIFNNKLDISIYSNYTGNTLTNINSRVIKSDFDLYSGSTNSVLTSHTLSIANKLDTSVYLTYTGNTLTQLGTKLNISDFNTYSSLTLTNINSRLIKLDFDIYSSYTNSVITANTLNIGTKVNSADFNPYSSNTLNNINSRLIKQDFDIYSANTLNLINTKQNLLSLTTTGSTGFATLNNNILNIPNYIGTTTLAAGSTGQIQFNNAGAFGANNGLVYNTTSNGLSIISENVTANRGLDIYQHINAIQAVQSSYFRSRGTNASPSNLVDGDLLGFIGFRAYLSGAYTSDRTYFGTSIKNSQPFFFIGASTTNNDYTPAVLVSPNKRVGIGNFGDVVSNTIVEPSAKFHIKGNLTSEPTLIAQAVASQTADLTQWQNSSSTVIAKVTSAGDISGNNLSGTNTGDNAINSLYSGLTSNINTKLDISNFNPYSSNTLNNINTRLIKSDFDLYSSSTLTLINNKLNSSDFNPYSSSTLTNINSRLIKLDFDIYSAYTNSVITANTLNISNKLNISDFNPYSSSTNTRISIVESQYLSGATNLGSGFNLYNNTTNKNLNFNTLSGGTNITLSQVGNVIKIDSAGGTGGGTGTTITFITITQNLGSTPKISGSFNISGTGFTVGKQVMISMATGTSGSEDDLEWDFIVANGVVVSSTIIKVYWNCSTFVKGNKKFNYLISS